MRGTRSRVRRVIAAGVSALLVATGTSACFAEPSVLPTVRDFLIAWQVGNYQAAAKHTTGNPAVVESALAQIRGQLDAASLRLRMGQIRKQGNEANARFEVKVDLGENGEPWQYLGRMNLRRIDGDWKIIWSPSIVHPNLDQGERLAIVSESPIRGAVLDANGRSLLRTVRADIVGVYPGTLQNVAQTITRLARDTKLDSERLIGRVRSAPPNEFLPLVTLQQPENAGLSMKLRQIDGLTFHPIDAPIAPALSGELVGRLGPATAQRLQEVGAPYQPGDTIGVTGLQMLYQRRLAGIPAIKVVIEGAQGKQEVLREWSGQPSGRVRTTLNRKLQTRAELALQHLSVPASLVAVHKATGEILAVANHGTGSRNLAMEGSYPPGLAFGIVSAEALLLKGMGANKRTDCPASTTVGGQKITNPGPARGKSTFQMNFAYSCATTLAGLSTTVDIDTLMREVDRFGLGKQWGLPVPAFSGSVPRPANDAEKAGIMLGQGGVRVSPLAMALVAGAADSGTWRPPRLLTDPLVPQTLQPQPLEPEGFQDLRKLTQRSVFQGTAKAARTQTGATVYGVSAAVDYTDEGRQKTVSWFVGSRGEFAFAIAVEGKASAAQLANRFLTLG
ncbi:penicillin-binding transpeptidase domain-containing protein [Actinomadura sp. HBU206391]|uniref:penicillin-binding transpeptidase domain-containing protein n=1 Tax=Actinomadura sp. HBU206391 TaxID=2731692 RepID=UPI001650B299|nr:penicillin-binding transpeptidase domain-containing protein [Actinomadura sp. HBU206391]MBC6456817.1 NTF2 domain-containing protein transpeptidase [Actinomadura sp. HBU206391]